MNIKNIIMDKIYFEMTNQCNSNKKRRIINPNECEQGLINDDSVNLKMIINILTIQDNKMNAIWEELRKNNNSNNIKLNKLNEINEQIDLLDKRICRMIIEIDNIKKEIVDLQTHALHGSFHGQTLPNEMNKLDDSTYQSHMYN